jgi:hypothetical protein
MKNNRIQNAFNLLRELDYIKASILAQLQDDLRELFDKRKEKKSDKKHFDPRSDAQQKLLF